MSVTGETSETDKTGGARFATVSLVQIFARGEETCA
jgi:hypothetical protein